MLNFQSNVGTVRWDSDLIKISTKRRGKNNQHIKKKVKFDYSSLPDGVHANSCLSRKWFRILIESVKVDLAYVAPVLQILNQSQIGTRGISKADPFPSDKKSEINLPPNYYVHNFICIIAGDHIFVNHHAQSTLCFKNITPVPI